MTLKNKKIVARHWLIACVLFLSFPLLRLAAVRLREFQSARFGIPLPELTTGETVMLTAAVYAVYLFLRSIAWSIKILRMPDKKESHR